MENKKYDDMQIALSVINDMEIALSVIKNFNEITDGNVYDNEYFNHYGQDGFYDNPTVRKNVLLEIMDNELVYHLCDHTKVTALPFSASLLGRYFDPAARDLITKAFEDRLSYVEDSIDYFNRLNYYYSESAYEYEDDYEYDCKY